MWKIIFVLSLLLVSGCGTVSENIIIKTNMGDMEFVLNSELAPKTVDNFVKLSKEGFYDGVRFHRVIKDFMVQTGDPLSKDLSKKNLWGTGGPGYSIKDEFSSQLRHDKKGLLSMANSGPNTGGSQFFITLIPTPWLDDMHSIFGEIVKGEEILDEIGRVQTNSADQPLEDVIIEKIIIS